MTIAEYTWRSWKTSAHGINCYRTKIYSYTVKLNVQHVGVELFRKTDLVASGTLCVRRATACDQMCVNTLYKWPKQRVKCISLNLECIFGAICRLTKIMKWWFVKKGRTIQDRIKLFSAVNSNAILGYMSKATMALYLTSAYLCLKIGIKEYPSFVSFGFARILESI